jgi:16S rRNA (cytidine1402-2'-O)-methyltransferase
VSGRLVIVATPIGNLGDITSRAREALATADTVCCEDTRRTRELLAALAIPAGGRLVALHEHNEATMAPQVVEWVQEGRVVALVTDAGTPAVSDPGARVVAAVTAAGLAVTTTPGPSAAIAALTVSGLATERFCVEGFLPRRGSVRHRRIVALADEERTTVLFEAPQRLSATLAELAAELGGERRAVVVRELTKMHEQIERGTLDELAAGFGGENRGEVVLVIEGSPARATPSDDDVARALADELAAGTTLRDAAFRVADSLGVAQRRAYEIALATRRKPGP